MGVTIGEVSNRLGIPTSTLRYYESEGLLPAVSRTSGGRREYSDQDLEACRVIECLKGSGLSIKQIKEFMTMAQEGDATLRGRLDLFVEQRRAVEERIAELQQVLTVLDFKAWYYEQALAAGTEDAVRSLPADGVPAEHRGAKAYLAGVHAED